MSNFVSENCHKVDSKELLQKTLQNFFIIILKISPSPPLRMCLPMITINYPVTLSISCENITKIHLICFWYDPTCVTPYILAESHTVVIFSLSPLANLSCNKGGTFPSVSNLSHPFLSVQRTEKVKTFLYQWAITLTLGHGQRALHHTNIIAVVNFLTLVLCSFGQHISLLINNNCQRLTFALKSFQQRLRCSRGFTISETMTDWLKLHLIRIKTESENIAKRKTLPFIFLHSFLSPHEQDIALIILFFFLCLF